MIYMHLNCVFFQSFLGVPMVQGPSKSEGCGVESRRWLGGIGHSLSVTITELSKAMVCGALSMGHCT